MLISIVIPLYNTINYAETCFNSIINQTYKDWECIIVDDCSTDGSYELAIAYSMKDSRFKVYKNDKNLGCGLTRRKGISLAKGEWFSFIDSDDAVDPTFLEDMLNICINHKCDIAICGTYNRDFRGRYISQDIAECFYFTSKEELYRQYMTSSWILQYNGNKFYSRKVIDKVEYSELRFCEDSMTTYKWLWEADKVAVIPRSYYHYIKHSDSNSNHNNSQLQKAIDTCKCVYDHYQFCKKQGFYDMIQSLKNFINPYIKEVLSNGNENDVLLVNDIKNEMGL